MELDHNTAHNFCGVGKVAESAKNIVPKLSRRDAIKIARDELTRHGERTGEIDTVDEDLDYFSVTFKTPQGCIVVIEKQTRETTLFLGKL